MKKNQAFILWPLLCLVASCTAPKRAEKENGPAKTFPRGRPNDAAFYNGHYYRAFDVKLAWHQAKEQCEKMGGYLCCIGDEDEQKFIARLAEGRYLYLGGTDEAAEGEWDWITEEPFLYEAWYAGQPNNYGGDENYLATYDGGDWVDVAASGNGFWMPTGFICEWEK